MTLQFQTIYNHPGTGAQRKSQAWFTYGDFIYIGTNLGTVRKINFKSIEVVGDFSNLNGTSIVTGLYLSKSTGILYVYYYGNSCFRTFYDSNFTAISNYYAP